MDAPRAAGRRGCSRGVCRRHGRWRRALAVGTLFALAGVAATGCATLQQIAALRSVAFSFDRISQVRIAGVPLGPATRFSNLGVAEVARLTSAIVSGDVPLELVAHVRADNPASNPVAARLVKMDWRLFVEDRETIAGTLAGPIEIPSGQSADLPIAGRFNLFNLAQGGAKDLFQFAAGIAGFGTTSKKLRFELVPTIDTTLGPIRYPAPVVLTRAAGP